MRRVQALPGPPGLPLLGSALQIDSPRLHQQLEAWCEQYGPLYRLRIGRRPLLVVGDHELIARILRDRPEGFRRTTRMEQLWAELGLPPGVFMANGDDWKRQRRMVMAAFDPAHVKRYHPALQQVAQRLAARWRRALREDRSIVLQADLMRFTVDTIAGLAFGADVNTLDADGDVIQQHLDKIFPALFRRLLAPLPLWRLWSTAADRQLQRSVDAVKAAVDGFVARARQQLAADPILRASPANLLQAMIAAADEPGSGMSDAQVAGNVLTLLLAGEDTTANTLAWMIHLLWLHPQVLRLAIEEVRRVCGDAHAVTLEQLDQLDFVEACAHETMRLKPVAPTLPLQALHEQMVGDVSVPAGHLVVSLMRRDGISERHVDHAGLFDPQRWLGQGGPARAAASVKRVSMPFGAGPRICPGRYLALLEIKLAMATLLGGFDIADVATPDGGPAREQLAFTMAPVGLTMGLRERH